MNYERKIYAGLALAIFGFIPLIATLLVMVQKLTQEQTGIIEANARQRLLVERLQFFHAAESGRVPIYVFTRDKTALEKFYEYHRLFLETLEQIRRTEVDPADIERLQRLRADSHQAYSYVKPGLEMMREGKTPKQVHRYFRSHAGPLTRDVGELARQLAISSGEHEARARAGMNRSIENLMRTVAGLGLAAIALTVWATTLIIKISRQKRWVDEQAERLSNARKEIVEIVAHDLKSPTATIQMSTDLIREELDDGLTTKDLRRRIDIVDRAAKNIMHLVTDLLDHAKIEAGTMVIEPKPCDLGGVIFDVVARFQPLAEAKRIHLKTDLETPEVSLNCDPGKIDQALSNLLSNAIKFTPPGGRVSVNCAVVDGHVALTIKDSGPGLSDEQKVHVFDRYWHVQQAGDQATGLGLAIVKSIVAAHHGGVWVESEPRQGATFGMSLPLA